MSSLAEFHDLGLRLKSVGCQHALYSFVTKPQR